MQFERNPNEVAARYRVLRVGNDLKLSDGTRELPVKRQGFFLSLGTTPISLRWHAKGGAKELSKKLAEEIKELSKELGEEIGDSPDWLQSESFYEVGFLVADCRIGFSGDEGWSSDLVNNCFFVIDGEALRYVPLSELTVLNEEQFKIQMERHAAIRGTSPSVDTHSTGNLDPPLAYAKIAHSRALPEFGSAETLACIIGVSQSDFEKLVEGCLGGRISGAHFHGIGGALSASFEHGAARDVIVLAGDEFNVRIDSLSFQYRV